MNELKDKVLNEYSRIFAKMHSHVICRCNRQRKTAITAFKQFGFPNKKVEDWKYTPLSFLNMHDFDIAKKNDTVEIPDDIKNEILSYSEKFTTVCLVNGFYNKDLSSSIKTKGIHIVSLAYGLSKEPNKVERFLPSDIDYQKYIFTAINHAIAEDGVFIRVDCHTQLDKPICIINLNVSNDKPIFSNPRNIISVGNNSIASVLSIDMFAGKHHGFSNSSTEIMLKDYTYFDYIVLQNSKNEKLYNFNYTGVEMGKHTNYNKTVISMNGNYIRNTDNVIIKQEAADVNMHGLFFADNNNLIDNHTYIEHDACACTTNENYKGIITDKATGVFNGIILVKPDAQQTQAFQSNHNILLSDDATINTKPELEIYADDVKCSHGATSGSIDPEQVFYLKARGISEEKARSLLIAGFAEDIISKINIEEIRSILTQDIYKKLNLDLMD